MLDDAGKQRGAGGDPRAARAGKAALERAMPRGLSDDDADDRRLVFRFRFAVRLSAERAARARSRRAITIRYKPVLFAGLLGAHGQKGPAEIPAKRVFTYRFCLWQAKRLGIPLKFPPEHPFNPLPLLRLAIACDCDAGGGASASSASSGATAACPICRSSGPSSPHELGMPDASARIASSEVKDALRRNTDEAIARGVFGVPTLALGDELFWGADATQMAADYVAAGCRFDDPEYARIAQLPVGATRKEASAKSPPPRAVRKS